MLSKRNDKHLKVLASASLISEGEFIEDTSGEVSLIVPLNPKKTMMLVELVKNQGLTNYVRIETRKGQFVIHSHHSLKQLKEQWYCSRAKIFSRGLDPALIDLETVIACLNIFGERKLESISIKSSIDKDFIKTIAYCIEHHVKVPVIPGANQIKVTNVTKLIINTIQEVPVIYSAELLNFLTEKEKKGITEGALV